MICLRPKPPSSGALETLRDLREHRGKKKLLHSTKPVAEFHCGDVLSLLT